MKIEEVLLFAFVLSACLHAANCRQKLPPEMLARIKEARAELLKGREENIQKPKEAEEEKLSDLEKENKKLQENLNEIRNEL